MARLGSVRPRPNRPGGATSYRGSSLASSCSDGAMTRTRRRPRHEGARGGQNVGAFHGVERGASVIRRHPAAAAYKQWRRLLASSLPYRTIPSRTAFSKARETAVSHLFLSGAFQNTGPENLNQILQHCLGNEKRGFWTEKVIKKKKDSKWLDGRTIWFVYQGIGCRVSSWR